MNSGSRYPENQGDVIFELFQKGKKINHESLEQSYTACHPFSNAPSYRQSFFPSTILFPSANKHIPITCHGKIKQTFLVLHPPSDVTPFLCCCHSDIHSKSYLYSPSTPSLLLVFLDSFQSGFHLHFSTEITHDLQTVDSNGVFSILIMYHQQHLTELIAPSSLKWFLHLASRASLSLGIPLTALWLFPPRILVDLFHLLTLNNGVIERLGYFSTQ